MFGTHIDSSADFFRTGTALLGAALTRMEEKGVAGVEYAIYDIYDPDPALYRPSLRRSVSSVQRRSAMSGRTPGPQSRCG